MPPRRGGYSLTERSFVESVIGEARDLMKVHLATLDHYGVEDGINRSTLQVAIDQLAFVVAARGTL